MGTEFDQSYAAIEPTLLAVVRTAQERVAAGAADYIPAVLDETGQHAAVNPFARVSSSALVGVTGDGRPVDSLLYESVIGSKVRVSSGSSTMEALRTQGQWLTSAVGTLLSDTGRQAESLHMGVRPVSGYVRMLEPPSCSRCVVLAGKWFKKNQGFQRHPKCDCRHIPSSESIAGDMTVDPVSYFDSLTPAQQDATFTKAGAEALRADANMSQVVNARRGMRPAQVGGRDILITSEGTTKRAVAYRAGVGSRGAESVISGSAMRNTRNGPELRLVHQTRAKKPRLMPETIQQIATDRADYLRLLNLNGYMG